MESHIKILFLINISSVYTTPNYDVTKLRCGQGYLMRMMTAENKL